MKTFKGGNSRTIYKSLKSVFLKYLGTEREVQFFLGLSGECTYLWISDLSMSRKETIGQITILW